MPKISAGLLLYQLKNEKPEVYLVHPGGPFFAKKDEGYWSIPKGLIENGENLLAAAKREFEEETGITPPEDTSAYIPLGSIKQAGGKIVHAWAFNCAGKCPAVPKSNLCEVEWPPCSGKKQQIPEVDRAEFFSLDTARKKIKAAQWPLIEKLETYLKNRV